MRFNVELGAMASPAYDGRASAESRLLARALERNLRDSGMLDMEALCIAAGRKVPRTRDKILEPVCGGFALGAAGILCGSLTVLMTVT